MSKSNFGLMAAAGILATGLGIMVISTFTSSLYATDQKAVGYPVNVADASSGAAPAAKGPELMPDWGTIFADSAKLQAYVAQGQKVTQVCAACHDVTAAGTNKTGPGLADVLGRKAGTKAGFQYSDGMKAFGQVWTYDEIYNFLKSPKDLVAGTKMSFPGLPKDDDRIAAIAYLKSISPNAPALPKPDPTRDPAKVAAAAAAAPAASATNAVAPAAATNAVAPAAATNAVAPAKKG